MAGLLDFLQSASNAAASNVTGPVDGIAWLLRKAGLDVGEPVGGSDWAKRQGLMRDVPQSGASLAGETAGLLGPIAVAAKAPQIARGLLQAGENLAAPRTMNPELGAIVWHGSPHKFDKFDASKIGTGEGAQAYGHGLYLAESPEVAKQYRRMADVRLKDKAGASVPFEADVQWVAKDLADNANDYTKVRSMLDEHGKLWPWPAEIGKKHLAKWEQAGVTATHDGALYKVDLPDDKIARMLDWDKPLSQQAPEVQRAIEAAGIKTQVMRDSGAGSPAYMAPATGMEVYASGRAAFGESGFSDALRRAGIPGIRYLDGGSRGAGAGTSNYVVFPGEENILTILERNGIPIR